MVKTSNPYIEWVKHASGRGMSREEITAGYHAQKAGQAVNLPPKMSENELKARKPRRYSSASPCARRDESGCRSAASLCRWNPSKKSPKTGKLRKAHCRAIKQSNRLNPFN